MKFLKPWFAAFSAAFVMGFAQAADSVAYCDASGKAKTCKKYTKISASTATLESGKWYVVSKSVTCGTLSVTGTVNLILCDGAKLTVTGRYCSAAVEVPLGNAVTIYGQSKGTGRLIATGGVYGAGIGGGRYGDAGKITINGGKISAVGGYEAAGIGGGYYGGCGQVTINGGTVDAWGDSAAGIGFGHDGSDFGESGSVTINGGKVTAWGGNQSAGIGNGYYGCNYGGSLEVTIKGGTVTAYGGEEGSGIGGGYYSRGDTVTIVGGKVTAYGGEKGSGIGGGGDAESGSVTMSGGTVTAVGGFDGSGVGEGYGGAYGSVTISRGKVMATGGKYASGIGGGYGSEEHTVSISGGTVTAFGGAYGAAGIGAGFDGWSSGVTISGGTVTAEAGPWGGAGIGGCVDSYEQGGTVLISGGTVKATGGEMGPGIGSGDNATDGGVVTIEGGTVTAVGGRDSAGIGGGGSTGGAEVTVCGGSVKAIGGEGVAGIGGGRTSGSAGTLSVAEGVAVEAGSDELTLAEKSVGEDGSVELGGERHYSVHARVDARVGVYGKWFLAGDLGVAAAIAAETAGSVYSVKVTGLPAGLKLKYSAAVKDKKGKVITPAKKAWWIEGVATAAVDGQLTPVYVTVTVGKVTTVETLHLSTAAQSVTELDPLALGQEVLTFAGDWLEGVTNGWTVSGLPAGLTFAAKDVYAYKNPTKKTGKYLKQAAMTIVGTTTKAGLYTITASRKTSGYSETLKYRVMVTPAPIDVELFGEELTDVVTTAYESYSNAVPVVVDKVTGLPAGLAFAANDVYAYKNPTKKTGKYLKQSAQTIVGTPTKPGTYVVTYTKNIKSGKTTVAKTAQVVWTVEKNETLPNLTFNESGAEFAAAPAGVRMSDLFAFDAAVGATVKATGLPKGVKLVQLEDGRWGFSGAATSPVTVFVTVTATVNGNTESRRLAIRFDALPAWAKGMFDGYAVRADGQSGALRLSVTSAGKISGTLRELGTNWTVSASCYTGHDEGEYYCTNLVAKYTYTVKSGKKSVKKTLTRRLCAGVRHDTVDTVERGCVEGYEDGICEFIAYQNLWSADYKTLGKELFYQSKKVPYRTFTYTAADCEFLGEGDKLTLKISSSGGVTATLSHPTGKKDKKTKKEIVYKPTWSTTLIPETGPDVAAEFMGFVVLYFPASEANAFGGIYEFVTVLDPRGSGGVQLWKGGPYWADCNVGAACPEDVGYFFSWGDTIGYLPEGGYWWVYCYISVSWFSSSHTSAYDPFSSGSCPSYGMRVDELQAAGWLDEDGNLGAEYDAAHVQLGEPWRLPTAAEYDELLKNCDFVQTTRNGVNGWLVKGRGTYATRSIFLPTAGVASGDTISEPLTGCYSSSTPYSDRYSQIGFFLDVGGVYTDYMGRYFGYLIRPVR